MLECPLHGQHAEFTLFLSWVQVSSDTYIVKSSAGEDRARRVLRELEGFHQLIGSTLVFRNTELPELPIEVLLIGDEKTMKNSSRTTTVEKSPSPVITSVGRTAISSCCRGASFRRL